ncbi:hypothetical protein MPTK1_7g11860 [Marchantia polymorpha subsp. ruderalis]|uniref:Uncharacterized protein n=2 Tax=Marchantia polymorpha TaxID=3197 RepID=A0AAF6BYK4_MARPO|nr:hypothetical protein MARPO_0003s0197 [Marchantia polymorpha]BBN17088.1 hypothetical protein Mp_7g11860 [Marchantia polymorpha subsp. ruderalis]|eukprot:PTQ49323.1 hypothetical protein MARPO_0003s0197 [Marchantia polymorpha]
MQPPPQSKRSSQPARLRRSWHEPTDRLSGAKDQSRGAKSRSGISNWPIRRLSPHQNHLFIMLIANEGSGWSSSIPRHSAR